MTKWTRKEPNGNILSNLYVQEVLKDDILQCYAIYPSDGYVLYIPSGDTPLVDEDDNEVFDENNNRLIKMYCTEGEAIISVGYDFGTNIEGYKAIPKKTDDENSEEWIRIENDGKLDDISSEILEKAQAYDIIMGVSE